MRPLTAVAIIAAASVGLAHAQPATTATTAAAQATSSMQVRQMHNGLVFAPEVRITTVNDRAATLVGASAGWQLDRTLFVGAAGYVLANRERDFELQYVGGLMKFSIGGTQTAGLTPGLFLGLGTATITRPLSEWGLPGGPGRPDPRTGRPSMASGSTPVLLYDNIGVAEPQLNAFWNVNRWLRVEGGVGYRFVGAADVVRPHLRGVSGSLSLQFGGR
ncbi:MAG: hypothetical protein FJW29_04375 [Acidobacteria bacterium]|nr:hypothetical protein [Acidobacteriota bacterium]